MGAWLAWRDPQAPTNQRDPGQGARISLAKTIDDPGMGEAKRRSDQGLAPRGPRPTKDNSPRILPWLPLTRNQGERFVSITTRSAWIGIGALAVFWVTVRFIGPAAGWWALADG